MRIGFGKFNLAVYWKRKYRKKVEKASAYFRDHPRMKDALKTEPWYLLTNLDNLDEV